MRAFVQLFQVLDESTSTTHKTRALVDYFRQAPAPEAAWAAYFLGGGKPKRTVPTRTLREVALQLSGLPDWLFEECYQAVGDLAETLAHFVPLQTQDTPQSQWTLAQWMEEGILPLRQVPEEQRTIQVIQAWRSLDPAGRFLYVKLVGGGFRVGVSKLLLTRALAEVAGIDAKVMATRLMGYHDSSRMPTPLAFGSIMKPAEAVLAESTLAAGQPYPFFLAHPLQQDTGTLGDIFDWLVEWKYDGIRAQVVKDNGQVWIWSRGEELIAEQFPEIVQAFAEWPDGLTLDGELLVWIDNKPAPFQQLQSRLNRKTLSKKLLQEAPVVFMAYDLLRINGQSVCHQSQFDRRTQLEDLVHQMTSVVSIVRLSDRISVSSWAELGVLREQSRSRGVEGMMLKHCSSQYGVGRTRADGLWYKWKIDPMTVDAVLVYAQRGHGRRANLYTDYTFAVWDRAPTAEEVTAVQQAIAQGESVESTTTRGLPRLVPFAKAYSGLTDEEFKQVDAEIKRHTVTKFGPVRTVMPTLMFELAFEGIAPSSRHKSGVAVRFPRMLRIRQDKPLAQANTLQDLQDLVNSRLQHTVSE